MPPLAQNEKSERRCAWIILAVSLFSMAWTGVAIYGRGEAAPHHLPSIIFMACMAGLAIRDLIAISRRRSARRQARD